MKIKKAKRKEASLGRKLLRVIFGCYFIVTLATTLTQMYSEYRHAKIGIITNLMKYQFTFSESMSEAIWQYNNDQLKSILEGVAKVEIIKGAKITDKNGKILAAIGDFTPEGSEAGDKIPGFEGVTEITRESGTAGFEGVGLLQFAFDIVYHEGTTGKHTVGLGYFYSSEGVVINQVKYSLLMIIINSIIKTMALWTIFLISIRLLVEKPLNRLTTAVNSLDPNNPKMGEDFTHLEKLKDSEDQLGQLTRSFISLTNNIIENVSTIKDLNQNLEQKIVERTEELNQKNKDIGAMFENLELGVMILMRDGKIHPQHSKYLETILDHPAPASHSIDELMINKAGISSNEKSQILSAIDSTIGELVYSYDANSHLFPDMLKVDISGKEKYLEINWTPIINTEDVVERLMVTIKDVSEIRNMRLKMEEAKKESKMSQQLLEVTLKQANEFFSSSKILFSDIDKIMQKNAAHKDTISLEDVNRIFLFLHTIKGNARLRKFSYLVDEVHTAEQFFEDFRKNNLVWDFNSATQKIEEGKRWLHSYEKTLNERILKFIGSASVDTNEMVASVRKIIANPEQSNETKILALRELCKDKSISLDSIGSIASDLIVNNYRLYESLGIREPRLQIEGEDVSLGSKGTMLIRNMMSHCITNSIVHGFGDSKDKSTKDGAEPTISIRIAREKSAIRVAYSDNGKGLDMKSLKAKGIKAGILTSKATNEEIASIIFHSGITTASQVSDAAGRGVGMDAVKKFVEEAGGEVLLKFQDSAKNTQFFPMILHFLIPVEELEAEQVAAA